MVEPRYWPVFALGSGRVVGAELERTPVAADGWVSGSPAPDGSVPTLVSIAARSFAFVPAAAEQWWVAVGLRPGQVVATSVVDVVAGLLEDSGLPPDRLLLQVTEAELAHAVGSGAAASLGGLGVRLCVSGSGAASLAALRAAPVAYLQISLAGLSSEPADVSVVRSVVALVASLGIGVIGSGVESDDQLVLAGEAGVELLSGYRWGSPGSISKLVATWARQPVSG